MKIKHVNNFNYNLYLARVFLAEFFLLEGRYFEIIYQGINKQNIHIFLDSIDIFLYTMNEEIFSHSIKEELCQNHQKDVKK